jgi:hypothetical protein
LIHPYFDANIRDIKHEQRLGSSANSSDDVIPRQLLIVLNHANAIQQDSAYYV